MAIKPIREEIFPAELVLERNDFSYIHSMVDPYRKERAGPKGYPPSAMFMALPLMYLKEIKSVLGLIRFLTSNPEWLRILGLKRRVNVVEVYSVPDRIRFYRLARRIGVDGMARILSAMVVELMQTGIIRAKSVSLDAKIISAWFKGCRNRKDERRLKRRRHEKSEGRDASRGYDHHRDRYVYGYKVHVLLESETALPVMLFMKEYGEAVQALRALKGPWPFQGPFSRAVPSESPSCSPSSALSVCTSPPRQGAPRARRACRTSGSASCSGRPSRNTSGTS